MPTVINGLPVASTTTPQSGDGFSFCRGQAARDLWLSRLPTIRQPLEFWRDVAASERNVWAEAWVREILRSVDRFYDRINREVDR